MSYKKERTTVTKKRYIVTLANGDRMRRVRVRAHNEDEVQEIVRQKLADWSPLRVSLRF